MPEKNFLYCLAAVFAIIIFSSCTSVKPYQRMYLNDYEMQTGIRKSASYEYYYQSIREGAISPGAARGSGGCGCN